MRTSVVSILLLAAACNTLPRDPERTSERVRQGVMRGVGWSVASACHAPDA